MGAGDTIGTASKVAPVLRPRTIAVLRGSACGKLRRCPALMGESGGMKDVITRKQAMAKGLSTAKIRHRVAAGRWRLIFPGVYLTHSGTPTWRQRLMAATLARGAGSVASLECALHLWNLSDRQPPILTLAEPWRLHRVGTLPGVRVRRRRRLSAARRYGIPVTSAAQTVLDVLAMPGRTPDEDVALITRAVSRKVVTVESRSRRTGAAPRLQGPAPGHRTGDRRGALPPWSPGIRPAT